MPAKSCTVLACRDTLAAGLVETRFGALGTDDAAPEHATVRASRAWWRDRAELLGSDLNESDLEIVAAHRGYDLVVPIVASSIDDLRKALLVRAWRDGAWDMIEHHHGPLSGIELGLVSANRRWLDGERERRFADAPRAMLERWLTDAAQQGSLIVWSWRPMVANPHLAHWLTKDITLSPDGSRDGVVRYKRYPHAGCGRRYVLGVNHPRPQRHKRQRAPVGEVAATQRQRDYLAALLRRSRQAHTPLAEDLTRKQASAMIDALLAEAIASA